MPLEMSTPAFEALVEQAIAGIPAELLARLENVVIVVEDFPPAGVGELLGLYEGVPLTERNSSYGFVLPDKITIFRNPILRICDTARQAEAEVQITVIHEVAHHFGIDDDQLHRLGWG